MAFTSLVAGEVFRVGDSDGWTSVGHVDYKNWSATKIFQVGDTISKLSYLNKYYFIIII